MTNREFLEDRLKDVFGYEDYWVVFGLKMDMHGNTAKGYWTQDAKTGMCRDYLGVSFKEALENIELL